MKKLAALVLAVIALGALPCAGEAPEADAKSAVLMDVATGTVLYEKDAHTPRPPASVTKIMTMLLIMEAVDDGKIHFSDTVTASETAAAKGGSQIYLKVGEQMTVRDLLKSIAVSSANDCACAMAEFLAGSEQAFVDRMNVRAAELGMADTHFVNCTGLDDSPNAEKHLTSAYDIALMSRELLGKHPNIREFTTIWMDTVRDGTFGLSNTNKLIRFYPGATGLKTGFTSRAGYCLSASAQRDDLELIAVTMGCESAKIRNAACQSLLDYGFANYALASPSLEEMPSVPLVLGQEQTVRVYPEGQSTLLVEKSSVGSLETKLHLPESVPAPVTKGQTLGSVQLLADGEVLLDLPLKAEKTVEALTLWQLFCRELRVFYLNG